MTLSLTASRGFALILSPPPTPPPLLPLQSCVRFAALFIGLSPMDWTGTLADDTRFGWTPVSSDPLETLASEVSQQGLTGTSNGRWFLKDKQTGEHSIGLAPRQNGTTAWLRQQPEREVGVDGGTQPDDLGLGEEEPSATQQKVYEEERSDAPRLVRVVVGQFDEGAATALLPLHEEFDLLPAPILPNAKDGRLKIRLVHLSHTLVLGREPIISAPGEADQPKAFHSNPPESRHRPCGLLTRDMRISRKHLSITGSPPVLTHLSTCNRTVVITSKGRMVLKRPGKRVTLCCGDEIHLVDIVAAQAAGDAGIFAGYTLEPCAYRVDLVEPFLELQPIDAGPSSARSAAAPPAADSAASAGAPDATFGGSLSSASAPASPASCELPPSTASSVASAPPSGSRGAVVSTGHGYGSSGGTVAGAASPVAPLSPSP